uniref:Uncharacterized protein n=1 Tax=Echinococcus granulosus TaxID=6210 RepID=A0A068X2S5_ECHGR|nr:hypothetical protein EgrG_002060000 [Echinococcus granulosus]
MREFFLSNQGHGLTDDLIPPNDVSGNQGSPNGRHSYGTPQHVASESASRIEVSTMVDVFNLVNPMAHIVPEPNPPDSIQVIVEIRWLRPGHNGIE